MWGWHPAEVEWVLHVYPDAHPLNEPALCHPGLQANMFCFTLLLASDAASMSELSKLQLDMAVVAWWCGPHAQIVFCSLGHVRQRKNFDPAVYQRIMGYHFFFNAMLSRGVWSNVLLCPQVNDAESTVSVEFTPTIPHCSMATLIGLSIKVKLLRSLPNRFKVGSDYYLPTNKISSVLFFYWNVWIFPDPDWRPHHSRNPRLRGCR